MSKDSYDFAKRLKDKRRANSARLAAAQLAQEFAEPQYEAFTEGIDLHMAAVCDELIAAPPKKFSWLGKNEELAYPDHLWPHQKMAVMLTVRNKKTGQPTLNASAVGTGKTRVAASAAETMNFKRVLWITSGTLVPPTVEEITSVGGTAIAIGDQSKFWLSLPLNKVASTIFYVTHYETIYRDPYMTLPPNPLNKRQDQGPQWDCIIIDECTKLKGGASYNPTKIWLATKELCTQQFPNAYKMFLSATPGENDPAEIWAYLNIFDEKRFSHFGNFRKVFCLKDRNGKLIFNADTLLEMLGGMCIRQTVKSIRAQFPNYTAPDLEDPYWFHTITVPLNIDPKSSVGQAYISMYEEAMATLDSKGEHVLKPKVMLEVMLRLRQLLSAGKKFTYSKVFYSVEPTDPDIPMSMFDEDSYKIKRNKDTHTVEMEPPFTKHDAVIEKIVELQSQGEACIVFSCFNQPLENLYNELTSIPGVYRVGLLTGKTKPEARAALVKSFQQGELDVLLINKKIGAQGLNLQKCDKWPGGASFALHMDRWWNPAIETQANGRLVRATTLYPVTAYYFEVENSMDEVMRKIIERKAESLDSLDAGMIRDSMDRAMLG